MIYPCQIVDKVQGLVVDLVLDLLFGRAEPFDYESMTGVPYEYRTHIEHG